ncbi:MAG TPA: hypothetical protein VHB50_04995 [Bryobacteraceae bacterium]|nr:hypothetical protein [Bryobacteraceae bacterium]
MAMVPGGFARQVQLESAIEKAKAKLGPEAVGLSYRLDADSTGEPSIFFRIILAESATTENTLAEVTGRIATTLFDEIRPYENWGLHPYFNFGLRPEQHARRER